MDVQMTERLRFDRQELLARLNLLSAHGRVAFAAACATRLGKGYECWSARSGGGDPVAFGRLLSRLWGDLCGAALTHAESADLESASLELLLDEDAVGTDGAAAADGVAALAYAVRCRRTGAAQDALWVAQRAYDAVDGHVVRVASVDLNTLCAEDRILSHPLIQQELARQLRDLEQLLRGRVSVDELRRRATNEATDFLPETDRR